LPDLGSTFLWPDVMQRVFEHQLSNVPDVNTDLTAFANYLRRFWVPRLDKICVWDGEVPRTTNVAEGYHNGLHTTFDQ